jgi:hypothetical protein
VEGELGQVRSVATLRLSRAKTKLCVRRAKAKWKAIFLSQGSTKSLAKGGKKLPEIENSFQFEVSDD